MCHFLELTRKFADCLDDHGLVYIVTYNQSYLGVINVLALFITNGSLTIKTRVIRGIIDHDAVFVEGINIKATLNKQKRRMVPLYRKTDWGALKNICRLCRAFY